VLEIEVLCETLLIVTAPRHEAYKMGPFAIKVKGNMNYKMKICVSIQHRDLLDDVM
jgi:UDP-N-acetylglucosamine 2-epimerase